MKHTIESARIPMTVHYLNKFGILEDDGTFVEFREQDQEVILNAAWQKWLTEKRAALSPIGTFMLNKWNPTYGQSYEIEGCRQKFFHFAENRLYYHLIEHVLKKDTVNTNLPEKEESKIYTGDSNIFLLDEQANRIEVDGLVYVKEVEPEKEEVKSIHTVRPNEVYLKGWYTKENLQSYLQSYFKDVKPEQESQEELSNMVIYEWLRSKRYQTTYDENHEYKLYYEIDMPKIINAAIKELTRKPK